MLGRYWSVSIPVVQFELMQWSVLRLGNWHRGFYVLRPIHVKPGHSEFWLAAKS
jgi:hypothetical protein